MSVAEILLEQGKISAEHLQAALAARKGPQADVGSVSGLRERLQAGGAELGCLQITQALVDAGHRALVVSAGGQLVSG